MLNSIVAMLACVPGDPSLGAFVAQHYAPHELAKLASSALLEQAFAAGVIASPDAKDASAAALLALRERAAGASRSGAASGNAHLAAAFAALADDGAALLATDATGSEREPNDTRAWPDVLGCGTLGGAIDTPFDNDYVQLDIAAPTLLRAATSAGAAPEVGDTLLELTDEHGGFLIFDDDSGPGLYSQLQVALAPGRYFLRVRGFDDAVGGWSLTTTCTPTTLSAVALGVPLASSTSAAQPLRVHTLALATDSDVTLRCIGTGSFDPLLFLRNANGAAIVFNDDTAAGVLNSEIRAHLPAGSYQLWVQGFQGQLGNYSLQTSGAALALPAGCASSGGSFASKHEWDFYRCEVPAGANRELVLAPGPQGGGANDTLVALYDAALRQIDAADDSPTSLFGALRTPLVPGTYYASVAAFDGPSSTVGAYTLNGDCAGEATTLELACNGSLAVEFATPGTGLLARIDSALGEPVELRANNSAYPSDPFDSVVVLLGADGRALDINDDADASFGSAVGASFGPGAAHALVVGFADTTVGLTDLRVACALDVLGVPVIGSTVFHASRAKSGDRVIGLGAGGPAHPPFAVPGLGGACLLDPSDIQLVGYYKMGAAGSQLVGLRVPPLPDLIGTEYWFQNANVDETALTGWFTNAVKEQIVGL